MTSAVRPSSPRTTRNKRDAPKAMIAAVNAVVHNNVKPAEALDIYKSLKAKS